MSQTSSQSECRFIDTHCHLDGDDFTSDRAEVLQRAEDLGVSRWINVGYAPERWESTLELVERYPGMACMLGVHPGHAAVWNESTERELRGLVELHAPVAIGEIGLDFYRGEDNVSEQVHAFNSQLDLAQEFDLPAAIHMRNAEDLVIETLDARDELPVLLFHSFEGSSRLANWISSHHAWIGVGGLATRKKSETLRELIAWIGLDRIVLETDSPYLVPRGFGHRRNTPESIPLVARHLAEYLGTDLETVASRTTANAELLFWSHEFQ